MESFTACLTLQVLWKTSCNTDFVFLCLAAALTASSSFPMHSHKTGLGLKGFIVIEQGLSIHSIQHCRADFSVCKTSPPAWRYQCQVRLAQSSSHTQHSGSMVVLQGVEALPSLPSQWAYTAKEHRLLSSVPTMNADSEMFAF